MAARNVYSVGQVNTYIKHMFTEDYLLRNICVRGEVSNCKYHSSGHIYFTLKDASGTLSCVMFASRVARGLSFRMKEGDEVLVEGSVDVWTKGGSYQLYANRITPNGAGLLNERYEALKKKLEEMGMFSEEYKQPIPKFIRRLGVVTAPTGAAVHDIINIATRRNPYIQIVLYPAIVQGEEAHESIIRGIRTLDSLGDNDPSQKIDVIIVGRGGGSLEDLWAFNEEDVAQAVFDAKTPIISAVGHETDTVITDYVADLRAPTPSAAAELAVFEEAKFEEQLMSFRQALTQSMLRKTNSLRERTEAFKREFVRSSPESRIREQRMLAASLEEKLSRAMQAKIDAWKIKLDLVERFRNEMQRTIENRRHTMQLLAARLDQLSPVKRLSGSYGFITGDNGRGITSVTSVAAGDPVLIRMKDGRIRAKVQEVARDADASLLNDSR